MKSFLGTFFAVYAVLAVGLFFLGWLIFENILVLLAVIALPIAVCIHWNLSLEDKAEKLEKQVALLEEQVRILQQKTKE